MVCGHFSYPLSGVGVVLLTRGVWEQLSILRGERSELDEPVSSFGGGKKMTEVFFWDEICVREWEKKSRSSYSGCGRNNALSVSVTLEVLYITHMSSAQVLTAFLTQNETLSDRSAKSCQGCKRATLPLQLT